MNERYIKDKILITEVKNKFIKDKKDELYKKIIYQNPELEKYPEKINAIIFHSNNYIYIFILFNYSKSNQRYS